MAEYKPIKYYYGLELAQMLSQKILEVYPTFKSKEFEKEVEKNVEGLEYTGRVNVIADLLKKYLPKDYEEALKILISILGPENPNETGMFKEFWWVAPIAKFIQLYGLDNYVSSIRGIGEVTKRNTGEYAIRPYIEKYPEKTMKILDKWSRDENFHLRRLASEGCRPRLPWASKIDIFIKDPDPILPVLENLKSDPTKFVQKSVANNLNDILKDNYDIAINVIKRWAEDSPTRETRWIIKHALRNQIKKKHRGSLEIIKGLNMTSKI